MPEAVLVCDPDDRIRIVNPAAERLFKGRPVRDRSDLLQRFEPLPIDPPPDKPVTLRPRDVPNRWFELRTVPVRRGAEPSDGQTMRRPPRRPSDTILGASAGWWILRIGLLLSLVSLVTGSAFQIAGNNAWQTVCLLR